MLKENFEKYLFKSYRKTKYKFIRKLILFYMARFGDATLYLTIDPENERLLLESMNEL